VNPRPGPQNDHLFSGPPPSGATLTPTNRGTASRHRKAGGTTRDVTVSQRERCQSQRTYDSPQNDASPQNPRIWHLRWPDCTFSRHRIQTQTRHQRGHRQKRIKPQWYRKGQDPGRPRGDPVVRDSTRPRSKAESSRGRLPKTGGTWKPSRSPAASTLQEPTSRSPLEAM